MLEGKPYSPIRSLQVLFSYICHLPAYLSCPRAQHQQSHDALNSIQNKHSPSSMIELTQPRPPSLKGLGGKTERLPLMQLALRNLQSFLQPDNLLLLHHTTIRQHHSTHQIATRLETRHLYALT